MQIPGVIRSASLRPIIPKTTSVGLMNKNPCEHDSIDIQQSSCVHLFMVQLIRDVLTCP